MIYTQLSNILEGSTGGSSLPDVDIDLLADDESVKSDKDESLEECGLRACYEIEHNWLKIQEACCIDELSTLVESGDVVVTEGAFGDFIEKAKEFFKKIWEKVQEIFKNALMWFLSKFKSDKDFLSKYKAKITDAMHTKSFSNLKFKGYNFAFYKSVDYTTVLETIRVSDKEANTQSLEIQSMDEKKLKENIEKLDTQDKKNNEADSNRGKILSELGCDGTSFDAKEFSETLDEYLKGGSRSKEDIDVSSNLIQCAMNFLEKSQKAKSEFKSILNQTKKSIDKVIKSLETFRKTTQKNYETETETDIKKMNALKITAANNDIYILKEQKKDLLKFESIYLSNFKLCSSQSKALCVKVVTYNSEKHESYLFDGGNSSVLNSVTFI